MISRNPRIIAACEDPADVREALERAAHDRLPVAVRSGGHSVAGQSTNDDGLVIAREYVEDPVYFTLVPQPSFAARRTTMLIFHRQADGSVQRLSINRYPLGEPYESAWSGGDLDESPMAYRRLDEVLRHHAGTIEIEHRLRPFAVFTTTSPSWRSHQTGVTCGLPSGMSVVRNANAGFSKRSR